LIHLDWVKETGTFLVEIMPVMFIPICVGLMDSWAEIAPFWLPIVVVICLTTVIVMAVTGRTAQAILRHDRRKASPNRSESGKKEDDHE
jgi:holin-like protein